MLGDLWIFAAAALAAGIAFGVYMIIHRHAARNSDHFLREHANDQTNDWIEKEDEACRRAAYPFIDIDAEGNYLFRGNTFFTADLNEVTVLRNRIDILRRVIEIRLGEIPHRIYFDKDAWQQVKEDRDNWQDIAHFCRKASDRLAPSQHPQFRVNR